MCKDGLDDRTALVASGSEYGENFGHGIESLSIPEAIMNRFKAKKIEIENDDEHKQEGEVRVIYSGEVASYFGCICKQPSKW
jgi:hypothetical protein